MISTEDLTYRLSELAIGRVAVSEFEDWFVQASWNANVWAPPDLRDAVYSLELILAEYSNGHLDKSYLHAFAGDLARELADSMKSIRPSLIGVRVVAADIVRAQVAARPVLIAA